MEIRNSEKKEYISPETARYYLGRPAVNQRTIKKIHVETMKREMLAGTYDSAHQGILIGKGDVLLDGQHRLTACSECNVGIWTFVSRTEDTDNVLDVNIDQVCRRSETMRTGIQSELLATARYIISAMCLTESQNATKPKEVLRHVTLATLSDLALVVQDSDAWVTFKPPTFRRAPCRAAFLCALIYDKKLLRLGEGLDIAKSILSLGNIDVQGLTVGQIALVNEMTRAQAGNKRYSMSADTLFQKVSYALLDGRDKKIVKPPQTWMGRMQGLLLSEYASLVFKGNTPKEFKPAPFRLT